MTLPFTPPKFFLTTRPYPLENVESFTETAFILRAGSRLSIGAFDIVPENFSGAFILKTGAGNSNRMDVVASYGDYSNGLPENFTEAFTFTGGSLVVTAGYRDYSNGLPENFTEAFTLRAGSTMTVVVGYIDYVNWPNENFTEAFTLTGGTLS